MDELTPEAIKSIFTEDVAYKFYILSEFRNLQTKYDYQQKMLEELKSSSSNISDTLDKLIIEHNTCTKKFMESVEYIPVWAWTKELKEKGFEDSWAWAKRTNTFLTSLKDKLGFIIILSVISFLLFLYVTHSNYEIIKKSNKIGVLSNEKIESPDSGR